MESFERMVVDHRGGSTPSGSRGPPDLDLLLRYADALAKLGRVRESLHAFDRAARLAAPQHPHGQHGQHGHGQNGVAVERLRPLASALLDQVGGVAAGGGGAHDARPRELTSLTCPACDCVLQCPVTLPCGHTSCRRCLSGRDARLTCPKCPYRTAAGAQVVTNVLVQRLVERWWGQELRAALLRDQGNALFHDRQVQDALRKYDEAVLLAPASPLLRSNRSHALYCTGRHQQALQDADEAVRLRPAWGKGHYRRGAALAALGRYEEALSAFCACAALDWRAPPPCSSDCEDNSSDDDCSAAKATVRGGARRPSRGGDRGASGMSHAAHHGLLLQDLAGLPADDDPYLDSVLDRVFQDVEKLKRLDGRDPPGDVLTVDPRLVDHSELDCVLCCRTLWKPVTTPCGHTYCCMCLDRCLDYSYSCPLCMTSLSEYVAASPRSVTEWVEAALRQAAPRELALRQVTHAQELSEQGLPVFVCTTAFPGVPCPLYVYEPRYRLMVRRVVESGTRTFGMAACVYRSGGPDRYAEFGTLLEVCDLVRMCDGSSILSTQGSRRFRVLQRGERDGYDVANVQLLHDEPTAPERLPGVRQLHALVRAKSELWLSSMGKEVRAEIERSFGVMPSVEDRWENSSDGPAWTWYLLAVLPLGPQLQVGILSTTSVEKRLRAIDKTLDHLAQRLRTPRHSHPHPNPHPHPHPHPNPHPHPHQHPEPQAPPQLDAWSS
ncbi:LON peptidase N-terminal domain and RING finger protein 3 [Thrips palmi]|uniref:LON peptidase N-terminal domain and RING finger protein 3 n=1 Tax=Thrips palmi TaxID=161013 RepID=A0A6P9AFA1_THRPL|nr:LON peptidase N-terminal domain and RING finger protein 3 [Thrips palmi]